MSNVDRTSPKRHVSKRVASPVGRLTLVATDEGLSAILWENERPHRVPLDIQAEDSRHPVLVEAERQLTEYFAGERRVFSLDLAPRGTEFQQRVWQGLDSVPYGTTTTYGQLAARLAVPRDRIQALGAAIGANPLAIIRSCHRVIGSDGGMRGYTGGVERKQQLLAHEGALLGASW